MAFQLNTAQPNLAHSVNDPFSSVRHRLVSFRQEFGQDRKVLHWILRTFRVGLKIDNVGRRMPGKILLQNGPGAGQNPAASIETRNRSSEDITREGEGCDVAAGRTSVSVQINFRTFLAPDENPVGRVGMREQVSSRLRRFASPSQAYRVRN